MNPMRMNRKYVALCWVQFGTWRPRDASDGVVIECGVVELACCSLNAVLGSNGTGHIIATGSVVCIVQDEYYDDVDGE